MAGSVVVYMLTISRSEFQHVFRSRHFIESKVEDKQINLGWILQDWFAVPLFSTGCMPS
jgi:hypothetical protein